VRPEPSAFASPSRTRFGALPIATSAFQASWTSVSHVRIPTTVSAPTPLTSATDLHAEFGYARFLEDFSDPDTPSGAAERPAVNEFDGLLGVEHRLRGRREAGGRARAVPRNDAMAGAAQALHETIRAPIPSAWRADYERWLEEDATGEDVVAGGTLVALDDGRVVGYCLSLPLALQADVPTLAPMLRIRLNIAVPSLR